jgi:addiction module RelE/StbE family toxin
MAKTVVWSFRAQNDRKRIFKYWDKRNKSRFYSIKLNKLFEEAVEIIAKHPKIGKLTNYEDIRIKIVRDYLIIYQEFENEIHILRIGNSYQNPANLTF